MKKQTVSIGIPAYNEEANIKFLLKSLLSQERDNFSLKEIIIFSDGSTDKTVKNAESVKSKLIKIYSSTTRLGKIHRQNQILKLYKGDTLVLLDADILANDKKFVNNLVLPIVNKKADLVSGKVIPLPATSLLESVINTSVDFKYALMETKESRNSVYLCFGRARAFSKNLGKNINWPETISEDAYSYFYCISKGFKFFYNPKAQARYRSPTSIKDHIKQSVRFSQSKKTMERYFDEKLINKSYELNNFHVVKTIIAYLYKKPYMIIAYLTIYLLVNVLAKLRLYTNSSVQWSVSATSKKLF